MKRIITALVAAIVLVCAPSYAAQKAPSTIKAESISKYQPNGIRAIGPLDFANTFSDIADSFGGLTVANTWAQRQTFTLMPTFSECSGGVIRPNGASPSTCETSILSSQIPDFIQTDLLTIVTVNVVPALSQATNGRLILMVVNGQVLTNKGASPPFTASGTAVTWSAANAGFSLESSDDVIAIYTHN
jgi:hypothetical protein